VEAELRAHMAAMGLPDGRLPTARELRAAGANSLDDAVRRHGGYPALACRLRCADALEPCNPDPDTVTICPGVVPESRVSMDRSPLFCCSDERSRVQRCVLLVSKGPSPCPSTTGLRSILLQSGSAHGRATSKRRPNGYWNEFSNLAAELEPLLEADGNDCTASSRVSFHRYDSDAAHLRCVPQWVLSSSLAANTVTFARLVSRSVASFAEPWFVPGSDAPAANCSDIRLNTNSTSCKDSHIAAGAADAQAAAGAAARRRGAGHQDARRQRRRRGPPGPTVPARQPEVQTMFSPR